MSSRSFHVKLVTTIGLFLVVSTSVADQPLTIATWNVAQIDRRIEDLEIDEFLQEVDFDVLLVNEIKTQDDLDSLKAAMDREEYFTAISSFESGNGNLEVGIISRFPLSEITEFDRSPDNFGNGINERRLERVTLDGIADVGVGRGFLVAKIPTLDLYVIVTHLKSSRGDSGRRDLSNAQKRELVAAAIANHVLEILEDSPTSTVIVAGDFNVGVSDEEKNGTDLGDDRNDGYDDTHALLAGGLIDGLSMRSLAKHLDSTFVDEHNRPVFPDAGAIDVLYVTGSLSPYFRNAESTTKSHGSDHLAVFAATGALEDTSIPATDPIDGLVSISNAMPNPSGLDKGAERIVLSNNGTTSLSISGWSLRDQAGNLHQFESGTVLEPGNNEFVLEAHTMPLNNSGDAILLIDHSGVQRGPQFIYSREDVLPGRYVR